MNKIIGITAHVDAGKTTLSERLLFLNGALRKAGRVDHGDTLLDSHYIEKERGITIFSDQALFSYGGDTYTLLDTPGHTDFAAETERCLKVLDFAILVISGVEGIQGHTLALWNVLRQFHIPTAIFVNKMDREGVDVEKVFEDIKNRLSKNAFKMCENAAVWTAPTAEFLAERDEILLEKYLIGSAEEEEYLSAAQKLFCAGEIFPVFYGSALNGAGVESFLGAFHLLAQPSVIENKDDDFSAFVYKIRNDGKNRLAFLKILSGTLQVKDKIFSRNRDEKVHEMYRFQGNKAVSISRSEAGELCAVTGLSVKCGQYIGKNSGEENWHFRPVLFSRVRCSAAVPVQTLLSYLKILEDEEPMLSVEYDATLNQLRVCLMGTVQMEILKELMETRFGMKIEFEAPEVLYYETITEPVIGSGHFEPLRHYAEVRLLLEPAPAGSGIVFESRCSVDVLDVSYQNLIRTHIYEKVHKGVLTGMPLTDVKVVLLTGRAHLKHTEGGDFREAVYRAIRQGLFKAKCRVLEPIYQFRIACPSECIGRIMSDIQKYCGDFQSPEIAGEEAVITGTAPASEFMQYSTELAEITKGRGHLSMEFGGYVPCHNSEEVIERFHYERERDVENTPDSVFCSHGAGYTVKWNEADAAMHCPLPRMQEVNQKT